MNWNIFWAVWILAGIVAEFSTIIRGDYDHTLTSFMRRMFLHHPYGSAVVSSFLIWLLFHWIFDDRDPGWTDLTAIAGGVLVGLTGWWFRKKNKDLT